MRLLLSVLALSSVSLVLAEEPAHQNNVGQPGDERGDRANGVCETIVDILQNDDFTDLEVQVTNNDVETRSKRSPGGFAGNYLRPSINYGSHPGNYGHGYNYVAKPTTNFIQSFKPGKVVIEKNQIVHNYFQKGNYQKALKYFYAIPLIKVVKVSNGYVGHFQKKKSYTVSICKGCNQGHPQIEVRCNTKPYNYLVRRFVFQPQINNVNYNNYNHYTVERPKYNVEHPTYQVEHPTYQVEHPTYQVEHPNYNEHPSYAVVHPQYQQVHPGFNLHPYNRYSGYDYGYGKGNVFGYQDNNKYINQANFGQRNRH